MQFFSTPFLTLLLLATTSSVVHAMPADTDVSALQARAAPQAHPAHPVLAKREPKTKVPKIKSGNSTEQSAGVLAAGGSSGVLGLGRAIEVVGLVGLVGGVFMVL